MQFFVPFLCNSNLEYSEEIILLSLGSEFPVIRILDGLDGPVEFLAKGFGEKLLDWNIKLLGEDNSKTRVDIVLKGVSKFRSSKTEKSVSRSYWYRAQPPCCPLGLQPEVSLLQCAHQAS